MSFTSPIFVLFITLSIIALSTVCIDKTYKWMLLLLNLLFISSFFSSISSALPFLAFLLSGYVVVLFAYRLNMTSILLVVVVSFVLLFSYIKQYTLFAWAPQISVTFSVVGMSYILFRVIHLVVDIYDESIKKRIDIIDYINYTCFFLSFVSGPITRYQDHTEQLKEAKYKHEEDRAYILKSLSRVFSGYIKIIAISALLYFLITKFNQEYWILKVGSSGVITSCWFAYTAAIYFIYLYFNFTGYMDIVVGIGNLLGYRLPENFNQPFRSRSFLEFWTRWHMTLSEWFRIYFFNSLVKYLSGKLTNPRYMIPIGILSYFITFLVIGYWHTPELYLAFLLGLGAGINKLYQCLAKNLLGRKLIKRLNANTLYIHLCRGITLSYIMVSIVTMWINVDALLAKYNLASVIISFVSVWILLGLLCAFCIFLIERFLVLYTVVKLCVPNIKYFRLRPNLSLAIKLFIILYASIITLNPIPAFVYMGF